MFHNRLTHSLKVAQVGRRLAERLLDENSELADILSPDVVEAAALAHDLGHPPFGHVAEKRLCDLAENDFKLADGFEGNAQTFRILTRLSFHRGRSCGLNLSRATLAATLKYPWTRARGPDLDDKGKKRRRKYSVYDDDIGAFEFVRDGDLVGDKQTLEAQIMDVADSISYSVHDLEDFYRAGLVPIERIVRNDAYKKMFVDRWRKRVPNDEALQWASDPSNLTSVCNLLEYILADLSEPGTQREAELLENFRSVAITQFLIGVKLKSPVAGTYEVKLNPALDMQCRVLHELVRQYVILSPRLATQQEGQVRIVEELARFFRSALRSDRIDQIPTRFRAMAERAIDDNAGDEPRSRLAIDMVASLTEPEAVFLYRRIKGYHSGSLLDLVN